MPKSQSVSRRDFVRGAALAVAAPTIISSTALGKDDKPAPSERLTLGFIGIGKQSSGHLNKLSGLSSTQVLAVCDVHKGRRERARDTVVKKYEKLERTGKVDECVDYHELLDRKDIDAVVIGVPDHWVVGDADHHRVDVLAVEQFVIVNAFVDLARPLEL